MGFSISCFSSTPAGIGRKVAQCPANPQPLKCSVLMANNYLNFVQVTVEFNGMKVL